MYILFNNPTFISKRFSNGFLDSSYGSNGFSRSVSFNDAYAALQPDGKIVIVGAGFHIARLNTDGMPDSTFGTNGVQTGFDGLALASAVAIQSDGKIVVGGTYTTTGESYFALARYTTNGNLDTSLKGHGEVNTDFGFKRGPGMGEIDSVPVHLQSATTMVIQADGKIILGGYAFNGVNDDFAVARYTSV